MRKAVYAGSFDLLTNGHLWMIKTGARMFDELVVGVGINPSKKYTFNLDERIEMIKGAAEYIPNIKIDSFKDNYLVDFAESIGAQFILRGIRSETDYQFEKEMRNVNGDINDHITSVFLMPPRGIAEVSSSLVKGLIGPEGWEDVVKKYIPKNVFEKLKREHKLV